jgi:hypothetical protein
VPEAPRLPPEWTARAFHAVALSFALSGALISAFGVHMVPVLAASGLGERATLAPMLVGPAQVGIRLVDALFFARLHPLTVAAISASALPLSVAGLVLGLPLWVAGVLFATLFGVGQGLASIVRGTVPLVLFGREGYAARLGRLAMLRTFAAAGAPFAFAAILWPDWGGPRRSGSSPHSASSRRCRSWRCARGSGRRAGSRRSSDASPRRRRDRRGVSCRDPAAAASAMGTPLPRRGR